jgi:hypothetical protein
MNSTRRTFLKSTSALAAALPFATLRLEGAPAGSRAAAPAGGKRRPLLFDAADLPRIRANTKHPRFTTLWASLADADLAADRKFLEHDVKFNDHSVIMLRVRTILERSAFVYAVTPREDHLAVAKLALRRLLDYPKWDYFLEGGKIVMGLQRAPEATIAAAFALDWLDGQLTPAEVAEVEKAIADKGAPACFTTLHGMRYPDRVRGWGFDPEDNYPHKIIDFRRWPLILNATNLKVIPTAALGIAAALLHGRHPEAARWLDMSRQSARAYATMFGADGAYDEGVSYWGYTALHLAMLAEVLQRQLGIDDRNLLNYPGTVRYAQQLAMPTIGKPGDCVNFGDASTFGDNAVAGWVATRFKDPVAQHVALHAGAPLYQYGLVWFEADAPSAPPPPEMLDARNSLDLVVSRTGWDERACVVGLRSGGPANHEHADRNSVVFAAYGERLLHDPFKAAYPYTAPHWVLRLTKAHTAVLINGEGHQYHDGHEGTNPSWANARVVAYQTGPGWMTVTSDATEAYELVNADVARVDRTLVFLKPDVLLLLDRVKLKTKPVPVQARFQAYGDDLKARLSTTGAAFRIERPAATLHAQAHSAGAVTVRLGKFDLPPENGRHEYVEAESAAAIDHTLLTVTTARPAGGAHGALAVTRNGARWRVAGTHGGLRVDVTLETTGEAAPAVTIA